MGTAQSSEASTLEKFYDRQIQRQIVLAEHLFSERQALKKARLREIVAWEILASGTILTASLFYGLKMKNKFAIIPSVPVVMLTGYHAEQCTADFNDNVLKEANRILKDPHERRYVRPAGGPITLKELDERRKRWAIKELPA